MFEETHAFVLKKAIKLAKPKKMKGNKIFAERGVVSTDKHLNAVHHFYHPEKERGLAFFGNAKKRGIDCYNEAVGLYAKGKKKQAFILLGSSLHYLMDIAVPVHTKLIVHAFSTDDLEIYLQKNINKIKINAKIVNKKNASDYFIELARLSSKLETKNNNILISAKFKLFGKKERLNEKILKQQSEKVLSYAVSYSAGLIRRFEKEITSQTTC